MAATVPPHGNILRLENRNAAAWLVAMVDAHRAGDAAGVDTALRNAARAPHYTTPDDVAFAPLHPVLSTLEVDPACVRMVAASIGRPASPPIVLGLYASTVQMSSVGATVQGLALCGDRNGALGPARRADCERVLRRSGESEPTVLGRNAALSFLLQLRHRCPMPAIIASVIVNSPGAVRARRTAPSRMTIWPACGSKAKWTTLQEAARRQGKWRCRPAGYLPNARQRALVLGKPLPAE